MGSLQRILWVLMCSPSSSGALRRYLAEMAGSSSFLVVLCRTTRCSPVCANRDTAPARPERRQHPPAPPRAGRAVPAASPKPSAFARFNRRAPVAPRCGVWVWCPARPEKDKDKSGQEGKDKDMGHRHADKRVRFPPSPPAHSTDPGPPAPLFPGTVRADITERDRRARSRQRHLSTLTHKSTDR